MKKHLFSSSQSLLLRKSSGGANHQAAKFFSLEKHPRQKNQDLSRQLITPMLFM
ncbi:MAG TPA: hypothetical protein GX014_01815 [Firmicutes bacterium]|jgi:hypothetical protein|nr:hypothetical protein [Bacillota bacterium]HHT42128.1 hypothetical protein [Bacillota bacterium]